MFDSGFNHIVSNRAISTFTSATQKDGYGQGGTNGGAVRDIYRAGDEEVEASLGKGE